MNRLLIAAALLAVLPTLARAQVEKQVEVTKAYVPSVEEAVKLAVEPDMTDTVMLRPEIDYTVTPLSLRTTLATRPIRPATVTYWEFNRPLPFYLKAGAGYPLNSVLDFYASTQNPSTGYVVGYINHEGRYADLKNEFAAKPHSLRMFNRIGAAAGKYIGRHVLEGEVSYDNRLYHRYGAFLSNEAMSGSRPGARVMYGDAALDLRFRDDFQDLSRVNFEVALHGSLFLGEQTGVLSGTNAPEASVPAQTKVASRQVTLGADAKIARAFGRHRFSLDAGYTHRAGHKALGEYEQQQIRAGLRYGIDGGVVRFEAGAGYFHDKTAGNDAGNYLIPFLKMDFHLGTAALKPFVELDGGVYENSFEALSRQNPYLANGLWNAKPSVDYNGRFGIGGSLWRDRFIYRVYAAFSIRDNHPYWYSVARYDGAGKLLAAGGPFSVLQARQTVTAFHASVEYRPVSVLRMTLSAAGFLYNDEGVWYGNDPARKTKLANGEPSFAGDAAVRYEGRKVAAEIGIGLQGERSWTVLTEGPGGTAQSLPRALRDGVFTAPFAADLHVGFDWRVSSRVTLFAEGRNLLNRRLYRYAWYPEYGANFTAGVKANF